jgi:retron-type reverse transcriptase
MVQQLSQLRGGTFNLLNTANIVLLPKKEEASRIGDYRPISLVYSISKIFSKILANKLAPKLQEMVSSSQNAFSKKRCIHNNFVLVQGLVKEFHRKKTRAPFIKLDIAKAFDSVSWTYLLEVLETLGFGTRWRDWISLILSTASSRILLNGIPGR